MIQWPRQENWCYEDSRIWQKVVPNWWWTGKKKKQIQDFVAEKSDDLAFLASWNEAYSIRGTSMSVWLSVGLSNIFQVPKDFAVYGR